MKRLARISLRGVAVLALCLLIGYLSNIVSVSACKRRYRSGFSKSEAIIIYDDPMLFETIYDLQLRGPILGDAQPMGSSNHYWVPRWFKRPVGYKLRPKSFTYHPTAWGYIFARPFRYPFVVEIDYMVSGPTPEQNWACAQGGYYSYVCVFGFVIHHWKTWTWVA